MDNEMGRLISSLRKEKNMTQQELADKLNITDKAVSKWERGLSYPDISLIPKLSEILDIDPNKLLGSNSKNDTQNEIKKIDIKDTIMLVFKCVGFALAVATFVLNIMGKMNNEDSIKFLSLSLICIGITLLNKE